jgi:hypothetical protein
LHCRSSTIWWILAQNISENTTIQTTVEGGSHLASV